MQLAYGYAMTIHTAQGSTATEHIFALPSGSKAIDGLSGYTANTRHRHAGYIVTNESAEQIEVRKRRGDHASGRRKRANGLARCSQRAAVTGNQVQHA
jgi:ATP-dependent exoDNAse (exonuclease V) alpha subunit